MRSQPGRRRSVPAMFGLLLLASTLTALAPEALAAPSLSGRVRDVLGNGLGDVEILVVRPSGGVMPVASARSGDDGRFSLGGFGPGIYRVAALKSGYGAFIGQINTGAQSWLDVVLRPGDAAKRDPTIPVPRDEAWSLRLPRRSVLRETGATPAERDASPPPRTSTDLPVGMRVDQVFALRAMGDAPGVGDDEDGMGSRTRVQLGSALRENLRVRFEGSREDYGSAPGPHDEFGPSREGADAVRVGVTYDAGSDSRFAVNAYYAGRDYRTRSSPGAVDDDPLHLAGRSWGYDATWDTQLDSMSTLTVNLDYVEARLDPGARADESASPGHGERISGRSMAARGSYETLAGAGHRLSVNLRARYVDSTAPGLETYRDQSPAEPVTGLDLGLDAGDSWHVAGPWSLEYGLGYRHVTGESDAALVMPRVGGTWSTQAFLARATLSYHHVETWGASAAEDAPFRLRSPVGYRLAVEVPLRAGFRLDGEARRTPFQENALGYVDGPVSRADPREPIYFTDGNASVDHRSVRLIHESAEYLASLELAEGRVSGSVAPLSPYGLRAASTGEGLLRYRGGRIGVRVADSGTDVAVDYRAMESAPDDGATEFALAERSMLRLRVIQDLMRHDVLGAWRLIAAVRFDAFDPTRGVNDGSGEVPLGSRGVETRQREMSAGLSVLF